MSLYSIWNGTMIEEEKICISPNNRSFRYGDGCFETMKVVEGKLLLGALHIERLFSSLITLKFDIPAFFTAAYLHTAIEELVRKNDHEKLARVRLVVYRGDGGLYDLEDQTLNFIIQSWPGKKDSNYFNESGFNVNIYTDARKTIDRFSSIKSNNYLAYVMAAIAAKENGADDCILTNIFNRVSDATIANVFIVSEGFIKTPALSEGCVSGVMRKYLLQCLEKESLPFLETQISIEALLNASEVFLTNASYGIRWVKTIGAGNYQNHTSSFLHQKFIAPMFAGTTI